MDTMIIKVKDKFTEEVVMTTGVSENDLNSKLTELRKSYDMKIYSIEFTAQ